MKKKVIIIVSSIVALGAGALLVRPYIRKRKKGDPISSSTSSNTNTGVVGPIVDSNKIKSDAQKIYSALNLWTTSNDEKVVVEIIKTYIPSTYKQLEKHFNQEYKFKVGNSIENDPLRDWLEEDLSEENFNQIKGIVG